MKTSLQAEGPAFIRNLVVLSVIGLVVFGLLLFLPAWTFNYWQAWVFIVVFSLSTALPSIYLSVKNPAALERRMQAGPAAEARTVQRIIISSAFLLLPAMMVLSAFDHRFGWSPVPVAISVIGDVLVALGLGITWLVVMQNNYAAANITVESGQKVITTGLYGLVRHPMYVGVLIMMVGIPLALDSLWGLVIIIPGVIALVFRILDEEKMLKQELGGYSEYTQKVHYRLVPYVW
ncbi:MAG TPA: isoprenylcysteine carboxylmethyltransferase family protein [Ktedonosporobacter sp.]|nr:isoprenylcysteine carboxylmethyltransferase family protein [Ktedonosporobacter sp.]